MNTKKQVLELISAGALVVDVRSPGEFASGSCPGSLNIPVQDLERRLNELDSKKSYILCCASGGRSGAAMAFLKSKGFENVINAGPWTNTLAE